jgi:hypothetical protein
MLQASKKEEDALVIHNYPVVFTGKVSSCCRVYSQLSIGVAILDIAVQHEHHTFTHTVQDDKSNFEEW